VTLFDLLDVFNGSDGDRTKALYAQLDAMGPVGVVAVNLFRAQKSTSRGKAYRGGPTERGSYASMAGFRKQWALDNLSRVISEHQEALGLTWGWKLDPSHEGHRWVLYVNLPTGQVSFHTDHRGDGPDYLADWDGQPNTSTTRILGWIEDLFKAQRQAARV
jgi:hypothetical protein